MKGTLFRVILGALALAVSNCSSCPKGSYCPNATSTIPCPAGRYGNRTGQASSSACHGCPEGKVGLVQKYELVHLPGNCSRDITSEAECNIAAAKLGFANKIALGGSFNVAPKGCFVYQAAIYFNAISGASSWLAGIVRLCEIYPVVGMSQCSLCSKGSYCPNATSSLPVQSLALYGLSRGP